MAAGSARPCHSRHGGFTWIELLVIIILLLFVLAFLAPASGRNGETANRVKCSSNLRQIGQAILLYSNENKGAYPRTLYDPASSNLTSYTGANVTNPFAPGGPVNDVSAAYFLLLRTEDITSEVFICPTVDDAIPWDFGGGTALTRSNWPSRRYLNYSFANPYPSPAAAAAGYKLDSKTDPTFAVASDMNPGDPALLTSGTSATASQMRALNSLNHNQDGQNVLYADGHVEFQNNPFVGVKRDNIFTYGACGPTVGGAGIVGSPAGPDDSVLLPTLMDGPAIAPSMGKIIRENEGYVGIAIILGVTVFVIYLSWRRRGQPKQAGGQ